MEWMVEIGATGVAKEAARTLDRKLTGDLSLATEVAEAYANPTDANRFLQSAAGAEKSQGTR